MFGVGMHKTLGVKNMKHVPWLVMTLMCLSEGLYQRGSSGLSVLLLALVGGMVNSCSNKATGNTICFALTGHTSKIANGIAEGKMAWISLSLFVFFLGGIALSTKLWDHGVTRDALPMMAILSVPYGLALFGTMLKKRKQYQLKEDSTF